MDNGKESRIEIIKQIIEEVTGISGQEIGPDSAFLDDLELSSLEIMSIVGEIERKFSVKISEKELMNIRTVNELAEVIEKTGRQR